MVRARILPPPKALAALLAGLALAVAPGCMFRPQSHVGPMVEITQDVPVGDAEAADVEITFFAGKLDLRGGDGASLLSVTARDNVIELEPRFEIAREGRQLSARAWVHSDARLDTWDDEERSNEWRVLLGRKLPLLLVLEVAMGEATIDLGGVPLKRVEAEIGLGAGTLRFSAPNPIELERLAIELGAGSFHVEQLGNARAATTEIEVSSGEFTIDLGGEWRRSGLVRITGGMCGIEVRVPKGLALRVDGHESRFADVEARGLDEEGDLCWTSPKGDKSEVEVTLELDVDFGNVTIVRE
jgi:hypothetical protein